MSGQGGEGDVRRVEWRVVGEPGENYSTYRYTFGSEAEARGFIALTTTGGTLWELGPWLERREVTETPWVRVNSPASTDTTGGA